MSTTLARDINKGAAHITVAASNASTKARRSADFVLPSTAIQVRLQEIVNSIASTGGTIELTDGTFNFGGWDGISATRTYVTLPSRVTIRGQGDSTVLRIDGDHAFFAAGADTQNLVRSITIKDFLIEGLSATRGHSASSMLLVRAADLLVENVKLYGPGKAVQSGGGILNLQTCEHSRFRNLYCQDFAFGLAAVFRGYKLTFENIEARHGGEGIDFGYARGCSVSNAKFSDLIEEGIDGGNIADCTFDDVKIDRVVNGFTLKTEALGGGWSIYIDGVLTDIAPTGVQDNTFTNVRVSDFSNGGVLFAGGGTSASEIQQQHKNNTFSNLVMTNGGANSIGFRTHRGDVTNARWMESLQLSNFTIETAGSGLEIDTIRDSSIAIGRVTAGKDCLTMTAGSSYSTESARLTLANLQLRSTGTANDCMTLKQCRNLQVNNVSCEGGSDGCTIRDIVDSTINVTTRNTQKTGFDVWLNQTIDMRGSYGQAGLEFVNCDVQNCNLAEAGDFGWLMRDSGDTTDVAWINSGVRDSRIEANATTRGFDFAGSGWNYLTWNGVYHVNVPVNDTLPGANSVTIGSRLQEAPPVISGFAFPGETLTSNKAGQWEVNGSAVSGETGATYVIRTDDVGYAIRCNGSNTLSCWSPADEAGVVNVLLANRSTFLQLSPTVILASDDEAVREWATLISPTTKYIQATADRRPTKRVAEISGNDTLQFDGGDMMAVGSTAIISDKPIVYMMAVVNDTNRSAGNATHVVGQFSTTSVSTVWLQLATRIGSADNFSFGGRRLFADSSAFVNSASSDGYHVLMGEANYATGTAKLFVDGVETATGVIWSTGNTENSNALGIGLGATPGFSSQIEGHIGAFVLATPGTIWGTQTKARMQRYLGLLCGLNIPLDED